MKTSIIQIGNSRGVIIPSRILRKCKLSLKSAVEIGYDDDGAITIKPVPRQGWAEAAQQMAQSKDDTLLMGDLFNDENVDGWRWDEK
jgi:antitoxin MazE